MYTGTRRPQEYARPLSRFGIAQTKRGHFPTYVPPGRSATPRAKALRTVGLSVGHSAAVAAPHTPE